MTREELSHVPAETILWDKDFGIVTLTDFNTRFGTVQVIHNGEAKLTWADDLSIPTSLQKELG